jgi:uncharacterized protein (DUF427 family)
MTAEPPKAPERVADYPRPPLLVACGRHVRIEALGGVLADSQRSLRVLETFHPPTYYLPPEALDLALLEPSSGRSSFCEWKGLASYFDVVRAAGTQAERRLRRAVWHYPAPTPAFAALAGWFAVYPGLMDGCWLDGERVRPQPGGFYGGWITDDLVGPFKGDPAHPELI